MIEGCRYVHLLQPLWEAFCSAGTVLNDNVRINSGQFIDFAYRFYMSEKQPSEEATAKAKRTAKNVFRSFLFFSRDACNNPKLEDISFPYFVMGMMATDPLTEHKGSWALLRCRLIFCLFDINGSKSLDYDEFRHGCKDLIPASSVDPANRHKASNEDIDKVLSNFHLSKSTLNITFETFSALAEAGTFSSKIASYYRTNFSYLKQLHEAIINRDPNEILEIPETFDSLHSPINTSNNSSASSKSSSITSSSSSSSAVVGPSSATSSSSSSSSASSSSSFLNVGNDAAAGDGRRVSLVARVVGGYLPNKVQLQPRNIGLAHSYNIKDERSAFVRCKEINPSMLAPVKEPSSAEKLATKIVKKLLVEKSFEHVLDKSQFKIITAIEFKQICDAVTPLFAQDQLCAEVTAPAKIFGDIHGHMHSLLGILFA
jgi:hypothetical protein